MAKGPKLRVYYGPEETDTATPSEAPDGTRSVTLPIEEILPLLADAVASERTWLEDFEGDPITISNDLHEVLLAYQFYRRPSA